MFLGILRLLQNFNDPTEALEGAILGDSTNVDISVGDIYGGNYSSLGLPETMIASSFGKLKTKQDLETVNKNDVARSLLTMITVNTLTLSRMIAQLHSIKNVIWIGSHVDVIEYM